MELGRKSNTVACDLTGVQILPSPPQTIHLIPQEYPPRIFRRYPRYRQSEIVQYH